MNLRTITSDQLDRLVEHYEFTKIEKIRLNMLMNPRFQEDYKPYLEGGRKYSRLVIKELLAAPDFHLSRLDLLDKIKDKIQDRTRRWDGAVDMYFLDLENNGFVNRSNYAAPNEAWIELNTFGQVYFGLILEDLSPDYLINKLNNVLNPTDNKDIDSKELGNIETVSKEKYLVLERKYQELNKKYSDLMNEKEDQDHDIKDLKEQIEELTRLNESERSKISLLIDSKVEELLK